MWVVFKKAKSGLAYFKGDKVDMPEVLAKGLMEDGYVAAAEADQVESDLPVDLPGRASLIKGGLVTKSQVLDARHVLTDVPGIGSITASQIIKQLTEE